MTRWRGEGRDVVRFCPLRFKMTDSVMRVTLVLDCPLYEAGTKSKFEMLVSESYELERQTEQAEGRQGSCRPGQRAALRAWPIFLSIQWPWN